MKYLLDSETVSSFYNEADKFHEAINIKMLSFTDDDIVCISVLTLYELEYGRANAPKELLPDLEKRTQLAQSDFQVIPLSFGGASIFGDLKKALRIHWGTKLEEEPKKQHMKKQNIDVMLASTAIVEDAILVSSDKIYPTLAALKPQFKTENWTR